VRLPLQRLSSAVSLASVALSLLLGSGCSLFTPATPTHGPAIGWRGDGSGVFPLAHPPIDFSTTENVVWKVVLPGPSNGTPVVVGDRVFVTAEPTTLMALRTEDGAVLWERDVNAFEFLSPTNQAQVAPYLADAPTFARRERAAQAKVAALRAVAPEGAVDPAAIAKLEEEIAHLWAVRQALVPLLPQVDESVGASASTPVSDGRRVYVLFANDVVASFDLEGNRLWTRHLPRGTDQSYPQGASLRLAGSRLIVPLGHLQALDTETGATIWSDDAPFLEWGTPLVVDIAGEPAVVTGGGRALAIDDGHPLALNLPRSDCVGPITDGRVLVFLSGGGPGSAPAVADAFDLTKPSPVAGELTRLWHLDLGLSQEVIASPLLVDGKIFAAHRGAAATVIDLASGAVERDIVAPEFGTGLAWASPIAADGRLYASPGDGKLFVFDTGTWEVIASNQLEPFNASPVAVGDRLYVRGDEHLYAFASPTPTR
jgi:outer membrane protein assembly factor BamB